MLLSWYHRLILLKIHLSYSRQDVGVKLVVQLMNFLMQIIIVFLSIGQLLL
jgi:hypothetical protein